MQVEILGCKFLNSQGSGTIADQVECIEWCKENSAFISSNSYGGVGFSQTEYDAVQAYGGVFVAAAGNRGDTTEETPAAYDLPNIISVAASTTTDALATFSSYGL